MSRVLAPRAQLTAPLVPMFFPQHTSKTLFTPSFRYPRYPVQAAPPTVTLPLIPPNSRRRNAKLPQQQRPSRLIVVYGYGCDMPGGAKAKRSVLNRIRREHKKFAYIDVLCNDARSKSMTANIARRIVSPPNALRTTEYVNDVTERVIAALRRGEKVTLVGYSYGGSVVSRVAIALKNMFGKVSNLKAVTLGSIYIPTPEKTQGVNISHYVYGNDIARVCHKRSTTCSFVKFLKPKKGYGAIKSHLDYHKYIAAIAATGSTNLNRI